MLLSYPLVAIMLSYFGWAQATCQHGPWWLWKKDGWENDSFFYLRWVNAKVSIHEVTNVLLIHLISLHLEHFNYTLRIASGDTSTVVIELSVVLQITCGQYLVKICYLRSFLRDSCHTKVWFGYSARCPAMDCVQWQHLQLLQITFTFTILIEVLFTAHSLMAMFSIIWASYCLCLLLLQFSIYFFIICLVFMLCCTYHFLLFFGFI